MLDFTISLLRELVNKGNSLLARSFWHCLEPYGGHITKSGSFQQRVHFPFNDLFGTESSSDIKKADVAQSLRYQWSSPSLFIDPDLTDILVAPPHRSLIEQICEGGRIVCGRPSAAESNDTCTEPCVWFEATELGDLVFTPFTKLGDGVAKSVYQYQAVSWAVYQTSKHANGCDILDCLGRRRGFYRFEELLPHDYILG